MIVRLSIIIVSYNTRDLLLECLASIKRETVDMTVEVIVVDNASTDGSPDHVSVAYPEVRLIRAGANLGFAAANNLGLAAKNAPYVLFLNPDTVLLPGALTASLRRIGTDESVGALGCRILHPDGSVQPSARNLPTLGSLFIESFGLARLLPHGPSCGNPWISEDGREQDVGVVKGAFLLTRRDVLDLIGGFDERFFLYSEEQDWCFRVQQAGWKVLYFPSATIVHREGSSSPIRRNSSRFIIYDSETEYFRKHHGALSAVMARILMASGVLVRAVVWTALSGLGLHARRWSTAKSYWLAAVWFVERTIGSVPTTIR